MSAFWTSVLIVGELVAFYSIGVLVAWSAARRRWIGLAAWLGDIPETKLWWLGIVLCWWVVLVTYSMSTVGKKLAERRHPVAHR